MAIALDIRRVMVLQIAGGIVLGGLVLAFLLKTRAGWYVMVGAPFATVVGGLWGLLTFSVMREEKSLSSVETWAYLLSVPIVALAVGWWAPRTIAHYKSTMAERQSGDLDDWKAFKWAAEEAGNELLIGVIVIAFLGALILGPFAWGYAPTPVTSWGKWATLVSWGIVAGIAALSLVGRYRNPAPRIEVETETDADET